VRLDLLDDDLRESLAGDLCYQQNPVAPVQAVERQHRDPRLANPGWLELGAKRHDQQNRQAANALDSKVEQLARGRVDPMHVLKDHQHRLPVRQALELPDQRLQCPLLLALWAEIRQWMSLRCRQ